MSPVDIQKEKNRMKIEFATTQIQQNNWAFKSKASEPRKNSQNECPNKSIKMPPFLPANHVKKLTKWAIKNLND